VRLGRLLRASLALLGGLLVGTLGAEGVLRVFPRLLPEQARLRLHWRELLDAEAMRSVADPEVGFRFVPGRSRYTLRDLSFAYEIDERGYRNPSPWPQAPQVLVLGDSLAFGFGVDDERTWSRLLEARLAPARVVNLALPGYAPEQYARTWERVSEELHPELVIVGVFPANDVQDQELFRAWLDAEDPGNYGTWRFGDGGGLARRSYLAGLFRAATQPRDPRYTDQRLHLKQGPMNVTPRTVAQSTRDVRRGNPAFLSAVGSLARIRASARARGARTLFVLFPCKEEVYLPPLGYDTPQPVPPFATLFKQRGWDFLDLTPLFQERAAQGDRLYFEVDGHPDELGNRVVAEAVLEWIRSNIDLR